MKTIIDYAKEYKDVSFEEETFNVLDSLIFTQLVYVSFLNLIPENGKISLRGLGVKFFSQHTDKELKHKDRFVREVHRLLELVMHSKRYGNVLVTHCEKVLNHETQFGAMCFLLPNKTLYIAFEGTDTSIIGWKEDFMMAYHYPVKSQELAKQYVHRVITRDIKKVYIGGHSKGGNLAMTALMECGYFKRRKVKQIYNFDGPGFRKNEYFSKKYQKMSKKLQFYVPEESVFGMMLSHDKTYQVISSSSISIFQHDPFTWGIEGKDFIYSKISSKSLAFSINFYKFLEEIPDEERSTFILALFSIFEKANILDTSELRLSNINRCILLLKEIGGMSNETKKRVLKLMNLIVRGVS